MGFSSLRFFSGAFWDRTRLPSAFAAIVYKSRIEMLEIFAVMGWKVFFGSGPGSVCAVGGIEGSEFLSIHV
jgi:hypothetical protein